MTTIAGLLSLVINAYNFIIIIAAFMSWINPDPYNPIVRTVRAMTEPLFYRIRSRFPFVMINGFDLSPILVLVVLQLFNGVVVQSLHQYGVSLAH
ncbi:MAG: YggT family protein [Mailhella sp.]|nr:YggT family protein [Mailhella sp.]